MRRIVIVNHATCFGSERCQSAPTRIPGTAIGPLGEPATPTSTLRAVTVIAC